MTSPELPASRRDQIQRGGANPQSSAGEYRLPSSVSDRGGAPTQREQVAPSQYVSSAGSDTGRGVPTFYVEDSGVRPAAQPPISESGQREPVVVEGKLLGPYQGEFEGENTVHHVTQHVPGMDVVVGGQQHPEVISGVVLPALKQGHVVDAFDLRGTLTEELVARAQASGYPIRVVSVEQMFDYMSLQDSGRVATNAVGYNSPDDLKFAQNFVAKTVDVLERVANQQGLELLFDDLVAAVKYVRTADDFGLDEAYQQALDEARLLSESDGQVRGVALSQLQARYDQFLRQLQVSSSLARRGDPNVSTVWTVGKPSRFSEDTEDRRQLLVAAMQAVAMDRSSYIDGLVLADGQRIAPEPLDTMRDAIPDVKLVVTFDPGKAGFTEEVIRYIGADPDRALVVFRIPGDTATRVEQKFALVEISKDTGASITGSLNAGASREAGLSKTTDGKTVTGGRGRTTGDTYTVAVQRGKVQESPVRAEEMANQRPGQAIARTTDGIYRTTLMVGQEPSAAPSTDVLDPADRQVLEASRDRAMRSSEPPLAVGAGGAGRGSSTDTSDDKVYKELAGTVKVPASNIENPWAYLKHIEDQLKSAQRQFPHLRRAQGGVANAKDMIRKWEIYLDDVDPQHRDIPGTFERFAREKLLYHLDDRHFHPPAEPGQTEPTRAQRFLGGVQRALEKLGEDPAPVDTSDLVRKAGVWLGLVEDREASGQQPAGETQAGRSPLPKVFGRIADAFLGPAESTASTSQTEGAPAASQGDVYVPPARQPAGPSLAEEAMKIHERIETLRMGGGPRNDREREELSRLEQMYANLRQRGQTPPQR